MTPYLDRGKHLVSARELRAHLREVLDGDEPRIVGTRWRVRALVIPCPMAGYEDVNKSLQARHRARVHFQDLIKLLGRD